jgi:hypothetical protein
MEVRGGVGRKEWSWGVEESAYEERPAVRANGTVRPSANPRMMELVRSLSSMCRAMACGGSAHSEGGVEERDAGKTVNNIVERRGDEQGLSCRSVARVEMVL